MNKIDIKLAYRQIIDINSTGEFEKNVFNDSFHEFFLQAQAYNPESKFKTLQELIRNNPKANSLHYKVGFAVALYISDLNHIIPGLSDSIGKPIYFDSYRFEILESDLTNRKAHRVSILYSTPTTPLYQIVGEYMIIGASQNEDEIETQTLKMQQGLSITHWQDHIKYALSVN